MVIFFNYAIYLVSRRARQEYSHTIVIVIFITMPTPGYDPQVKVTELEIVC